jgi:hypothetical protein
MAMGQGGCGTIYHFAGRACVSYRMGSEPKANYCHCTDRRSSTWTVVSGWAMADRGRGWVSWRINILMRGVGG